MKEITFTIDEKGNVSIDVEGAEGQECLDIIKVFQEHVGPTVTIDDVFPEGVE